MIMLPRQGNISIPLEGAKTGEQKPVRLNHLYTGGKLCDMPMYNKATDINPVTLLRKRTIINPTSRSLE